MYVSVCPHLYLYSILRVIDQEREVFGPNRNDHYFYASPFMYVCVGLSAFIFEHFFKLILSRHASLTAGFARPLRHIATASSSPMLPNTFLT